VQAVGNHVVRKMFEHEAGILDNREKCIARHQLVLVVYTECETCREYKIGCSWDDGAKCKKNQSTRNTSITTTYSVISNTPVGTPVQASKDTHQVAVSALV
jgi:hypothetical protein